MWIRCTWKQGALSSPFWYSCLFMLECILCGMAVNSCAPAPIILLYPTSVAYRRWDPLNFQRFRMLVKPLLALLRYVIPWSCCFVATYLDISFFSERNPVPNSHSAAVDVAAQQLYGDILINDTSSGPPTTTARASFTTVPLSTACVTTKSSPLHAEDGSTDFSGSMPPVHSPAADVVNAGARVIDPRLDTGALVIDPRLDTSHISMGSTADMSTRSGRDESSNNSEGNISGDETDEEGSAITEVAPSTSLFLSPLRSIMEDWLPYVQALATGTSPEQALTDSRLETPSTPSPKPRGRPSSQSQESDKYESTSSISGAGEGKK